MRGIEYRLVKYWLLEEWENVEFKDGTSIKCDGFIFLLMRDEKSRS